MASFANAWLKTRRRIEGSIGLVLSVFTVPVIKPIFYASGSVYLVKAGFNGVGNLCNQPYANTAFFRFVKAGA